MRIPFYIAGLVLFAEAANAQQPELILPIGHTEYISSTKYSPDGKYLLTCSGDKTAKLWEVSSGLNRKELQ